MEIIRDFSGKKLVEYLKPDLRVCLHFRHGIGDTVCFLPIYETLKRMYPEVSWNLRTFSGQEEVFDDGEDTEYDYLFVIIYPEPWFRQELRNKKKAEFCCEYEIGIPYSEVPETLSPPPRSDFSSPLVGAAFQSTSLRAINVSPLTASKVWDGILQAELVPIEIHYKHKYHNPQNTMPGCVTATTRPCKPTLSSLIGLLNACRAFIGVDSGVFFLAKSLGIPVLYLRTVRGLDSYLRNPDCLSLDELHVTPESVRQWLLTVSRDAGQPVY